MGSEITWLDYALLAIIGISALYSIFRGFVREMLSLLGWVMSFWVAIKFAPLFAAQFEGVISTPGVRFIVAFILLLLAVLVVAAVFSHVVARLVRMGGFGGMDRLIGVGFGLARGMVIASLLLMVARVSPLAAKPVWEQSMSVAFFEQAYNWVGKRLPADFAAEYKSRIGL